MHEADDIDPRAVPLFELNDPRFLPPGDMPARIDAWCAEESGSSDPVPAWTAMQIIATRHAS